MKTATIPHRDLKIAYDEAGKGVPLLLLHAFPLDKEMWIPQIGELAAGYRVVAPDLPGFGQSGQSSGPMTVESVADVLVDFLDAIGVKGTVALGGCSMGGYIAISFALRHPQRLRALILADTKADPDDEKARANRDIAAALARDQGSAALIDTMIPKLLHPNDGPEYPHLVEMVRRMGSRQTPEAIGRGLAMLKERPDANPGLSRITVPTLVIVGERDLLTPPDRAIALMAKIVGAQLVTIPAAGHLSNLEAPGAYNSQVKLFLDRNCRN